MCQNTAIKKRTQVLFHKPGNHTPALLLPRQKGLEVFSHCAVENALFRVARLIFKSGFADPESMACKQWLFIKILTSLMKNR
jgi:hypothetical protein